MREFSTSISEALANGLKPDESFRDTMFFKDLYNLVPSQMRLRSFQEITDVLPLVQEERKYYYPFPQWFRFENDNLCLTDEDLFKVLEYPNPPFDLKSITVDGWESQKFTEPFQAVDYKGNWILVNREGTIYKWGEEITYSPELKASSVTRHKNRTLIGGALDGFWTERWLRELDDFTNVSQLEDFSFDLGKNFLIWSSFDSMDLPFALFYPEIMFDMYDAEDRFIDVLYSNQFGFMEMPFKGAILDMQVSNDQVFIFGEDGICSVAMNPQSTGAGYHITGQQSFGLKQRGAVGGDDSSLVFIDVFNQLWYITGEGLQKLDYSEYMEKLSGYIWITKDPEEEIFYIGDSELSFLLADGRLTRCNQTVQQAVGAYPYRAGTAMKTGSDKAGFISGKLDIGNTDNKTLTGVAIGLDSPVSGKVRAHVEVNNKKISSPWLPLNPDGYAAVRIYGSQHQLEVKLDNYENINLDYIELKWQIDDKRHRRGTFTTQDSSGAG